jgi:hypothetical protein
MEHLSSDPESTAAFYIAKREAELVRLHAYLGSAGLSFEDAIAATNLLAALEFDLSRWKVLSARCEALSDFLMAYPRNATTA